MLNFLDYLSGILSAPDIQAIQAGTYTTDLATHINNFWSTVNEPVVYFPAGTYPISETNPLILTTDLVFKTDGYATKFVRTDNVITGPAQKKIMLDFQSSSGVNIVFEPFSIDGNAAGQYTPVDPWDVQQNHSLRIRANDTRGFEKVIINGIDTKNGMGDGILITAYNIDPQIKPSIGRIFVNNCVETDRPYERGGLTLTCNYDYCSVRDCVFERFEVEHDEDVFDPAYELRLNLDNVRAKIIDINYLQFNTTDPVQKHIYLTNCYTSEWINLKTGIFHITNCYFKFDRPFTPVAANFVIKDSIIHGLQGCGTTTIVPQSTLGWAINMTGGQIINEDNTATEHILEYLKMRDGEKTVFKNVEFKGNTVLTAKIRNGNYTFDQCIHEYDNGGAAILQTGYDGAGQASTIYLFGNICENAYLLNVFDSNTMVRVRDNIAPLGEVI